MGIFLNPGADAFRMARQSQIYVDKSGMIALLNEVVNTEQRFVCISRPRRFGKSMAANMICAYYDRTADQSIFDGLKIQQIYGSSLREDIPQTQPESTQNAHVMHESMPMQGHFNVLRVNMQEFLSRKHEIFSLLDYLKKSVLWDLKEEYPDARYFDDTDMIRSMEDIYRQKKVQFVVVIDEWDCIFREYPHNDEAQELYLDFLRDWLKDRSYIALAYMTGILPIKKYGSHSALNTFSEYSMEHPDQYAEYVGFTEEETRHLCEEYKMDFAECQAWYDGYSFAGCAHVYSPKSVVDAMLRHRFGSYWNNTETFEALKIYIDLNEDGLRDAIIKLMGGGRQKINTGTFRNDMTSIQSADDVMTLLVHLGYLGYDSTMEEVFIPNNEIMREFVNATSAGSEWNVISRSIRASDDLLRDVWQGDAEAVARGVEEAHFETSVLQYNDENALSYVLSLAFYSARRYYNVIREMPAGKGYADLIFLPRPAHQDRPAMIIELKRDDTPLSAIAQIHERQYDRALADYRGRLILAGICYDSKTKKHSCVIES